MTGLNSSVVFWNEEEILPRSLLLMSSGAGGDRLLFWHPTGLLGDSAPRANHPASSSEGQASVARPERASVSPFQKRHSSGEAPGVLHNKQQTTFQVPRGHASTSPAFSVPVSTSNTIGSPLAGEVPGDPFQRLAAPSSNGHVQRHVGGTSGVGGASGSTPVATSTAATGGSGVGGGSTTVPPSGTLAPPAEPEVEGMTVTSLLSLLHPSTNQLQHKIYVKAHSCVFVGVAFSLTKVDTKTNLVPLNPPTHYAHLQSQVSQFLDPVSIDAPTPFTGRRGSLHTTVITPQSSTTMSPSSTAAAAAVSCPTSTNLIDFLRVKRGCSSESDSNNNSNHVASARATPTFSKTTPAAVANSSKNFVKESLTSFAIVFVLSEAAPPCVQSHYTELARLTGTQMCRSEVYWQYLSSERAKISAILDRHSGILSSNEGCVESTVANADDSSAAPAASEVLSETAAATTTTASPHLHHNSQTTALSRQHAATEEASSVVGSDDGEGERVDVAATACTEVYGRVARKSTLCAELVEIMNQVTSCGRVNVKIHGRYPVFFCLPFKAYAIMPFGLKMTPLASPRACWPAIRPEAVWRAMQAIRPYHTLLLTTRKRFLQAATDRFPCDANQSLERVIKTISTTSTLSAMASCGQSQEHCLRVALWLVCYGHAIIISPVLLSNAYTLAPLSNLWLQPKVFLQFAGNFPKLNFAEVLSSFSEYYTLQEHLNNESPATFWQDITAGEVIDLITWLLRRRLIVQVHTYITVAALPALPQIPSPDAASPSVEGDEEETEITASFGRICPECLEEGDGRKGLLYAALPNAGDRDRVLAHYRATLQQAPKVLLLFLRLMRRLASSGSRAAHVEELMFCESVDRHSLMTCVQLFAPFFVTLRLPDPVTACFAGIEWPD